MVLVELEDGRGTENMHQAAKPNKPKKPQKP